METVLFKRSAYDEKGSDVIASILQEQPITMVETYSVRRINVLEPAMYSWIIIYSTREAEFVCDILTVHELRWKGLSRDKCGVAFILGDEMDKRSGKADFLYPMLHDYFVSSDLTIGFRWVRKVLPKLFIAQGHTNEV